MDISYKGSKGIYTCSSNVGVIREWIYLIKGVGVFIIEVLAGCYCGMSISSYL